MKSFCKKLVDKVTVDMILMFFCTVIAIGTIAAAGLALVTPEVYATSNEPTEMSESVEVDSTEVSEEPIIEESPEPTPTYSFTTRRLGVTITDYDPDENYSSLMMECVKNARDSDDPDTYLAVAEIYEARRNIKILSEGLDKEGYETTDYFSPEKALIDIVHIYFPPYMPYTQYEAERLAALINAEAGSWFVSEKHQRDVASVVVNRVNSPAFKESTSIVAAIEAPGQYPHTKDLRYFTERELANAIYVLENGPTTTGVWQANFIQGHIEAVYDYRNYGWQPLTYICS